MTLIKSAGIFVLLMLFTLSLFAIRLGVQLSNWQGMLQSGYVSGLQILQTAPGYPAYGVLLNGDIITEALLIPNSQIWNTPNNPNGGFMLQLNPFAPISSQLSIPWYQLYGLRYMNTTDQNGFSNFIASASFGSNVILRVFRPSWNSWTLASVILDVGGQGSVWMMQSVQQQGNQVMVQPSPSQGGQIQVQPSSPSLQLKIWIDF